MNHNAYLQNFSLGFLFLLLLSCQEKKEHPPTERLQEDFQKIDIHTHYRYDRNYIVPLLQKWNMRTVLVDVARKDTGSLNRWNALKTQFKKYPDQFFLCSSFEASDIDNPEFAKNTINKLREDLAFGAVMVKVWKNHGMVITDKSGKYIQIDDPRIQPVWDFLAENHVPVMAHIGEPLQAWRPLEEGNPHYNYYKNNPQYHAYQHPEIPTWETIMEARDHWVANNPKLTIIAAHLASMGHDLDLVAERLDQYPNLMVETAARWGDITLQDSEKVKKFFIQYQDRVLYGTDLSINTPAQENSTSENGGGENTEKILRLHWEYLSGQDSLFFDSPMISFPISTKSLNLPDSVLKKFYFGNAVKILSMKGNP